ncbi:Dipeptidyl peptidase 3 [Araneus ventricosus]|uniref:Dipeptidyl peptidase 3 n=1 Tax=Araneus ventricosus TaxID=182803 RepID=A0A4Y2GSG4_ARAVE|nr:Dipeptidyl peptidase 3 [Araneus ventricosus]
MYDKYSLVASEENKYPFLKYRKIVMDRKKPRRMFVQANTFLESDKVKLKTYPSTPEGMIQSWMERFQDVQVDDILEELWAKDKKHF